MARRFGRPTKREQIGLRNNSHRIWAALSDKPNADAIAQRFIKPVPEARTRAPAQGTSERPLERDVLAAVLKVLRADPRVALCERQQSGVFMEGNRRIRVGSPGALDIKGMLVGGRYYEIEVKRPGGKPEPHQAERIAAIRANGGIAGYCWSAESALALLPC